MWSISALTKASKTDLAVVVLLGAKKALLGRCGIEFSFDAGAVGRGRSPNEIVRAARDA